MPVLVCGLQLRTNLFFLSQVMSINTAFLWLTANYILIYNNCNSKRYSSFPHLFSLSFHHMPLNFQYVAFLKKFSLIFFSIPKNPVRSEIRFIATFYFLIINHAKFISAYFFCYFSFITIRNFYFLFDWHHVAYFYRVYVILFCRFLFRRICSIRSRLRQCN